MPARFQLHTNLPGTSSWTLTKLPRTRNTTSTILLLLRPVRVLLVVVRVRA